MEYQPFARIPATVDAFTRGYLECAEWAGLTDEDREAFELAVSPTWDDASMARAVEDCAVFQAANVDDLAGIEPAQAGHDFYLTRNRHGAGFWDRGLGEVGARLTSAAHVWGSADVYFEPKSETLVLV